jgi:hypothetical protein
MPRIQIYNEPTEVVSFRVPMSRAKRFKEDGDKKLRIWSEIASKKRQRKG